MLNPPHPGESILLGCLGDEHTPATAASLLGIPRTALEDVLMGRAPVTPDLARRLEKAGWSNASFWLRRQAAYDESRKPPPHTGDTHQRFRCEHPEFGGPGRTSGTVSGDQELGTGNRM